MEYRKPKVIECNTCIYFRARTIYVGINNKKYESAIFVCDKNKRTPYHNGIKACDEWTDKGSD